MDNFYFDSTKMTAFKSLSETEFKKLYPTITDKIILNTIRLQLLNSKAEFHTINSKEHATEIFSNSY